jgi:uncharacterized protein YggE
LSNYVEVVGIGTLVESIAEYRADVTLQVRAAHAETAIREVTDLRNECIRQLRQSGIQDGELKEGGSEVWRPWFWKKKPGQEASQKLLVACDDMQRLMSALGSLEPLFENQRFSLSVSMGRPVFKVEDAARRAAERQAIGEARAKAINIAEMANLKLGGVIEVEELAASVSRSGVFGDQDWGMAAMGAGAAVSDEGESLEAATRSTTVKFRVRFAVEST